MLLSTIKNWFTKKPTIRFYSMEQGVVDLFPIVKANTVKRKFLEGVQDPNSNVSSQNCPGIKKIISTGWIVPAPADFEITTNGDGVYFEWGEQYRFSKGTEGRTAYISGHSRVQVEPLLDDPDNTLKTVIKIESPWRVEASDDVVFLQMPVTYNNESRFQAAVGILDPRYAHLINIQLFWKHMEGKTVVKAGTPLCQLVPVSRKWLNLSNYDVTIDSATSIDIEKEKAFNYATDCAMLSSDTLASRITRTIKILNKYKTKDKL